ncbi:uncharacterized protein F5891DRAFT_979422 [Suillus fuscotomentosus]|uniref:Uncharacterized protein n=1 Tax=Suillus fuscotomentosus TaxID=1912939 RepID=A0AAD4E946_9AGAM|nr:uncharacterized protein F5891DRAFT_979422 [Suillus fuscotomentosus]KAG1901606.1 hypothetical protein F5891DRAFT_979422 [Suillus fuscotomentosus]
MLWASVASNTGGGMAKIGRFNASTLALTAIVVNGAVSILAEPPVDRILVLAMWMNCSCVNGQCITEQFHLLGTFTTLEVKVCYYYRMCFVCTLNVCVHIGAPLLSPSQVGSWGLGEGGAWTTLVHLSSLHLKWDHGDLVKVEHGPHWCTSPPSTLSGIMGAW